MVQTVHPTLRPAESLDGSDCPPYTLARGEPGCFRLLTLHSDQGRAWMIQTVHLHSDQDRAYMVQTVHKKRAWMVQTVHHTLRPGESLDGSDCLQYTQTRREPGWLRLSTLHSNQERAWMIQTVHPTLRPGESLDGSDCPPYTQTRREPG